MWNRCRTRSVLSKLWSTYSKCPTSTNGSRDELWPATLVRQHSTTSNSVAGQTAVAIALGTCFKVPRRLDHLAGVRMSWIYWNISSFSHYSVLRRKPQRLGRPRGSQRLRGILRRSYMDCYRFNRRRDLRISHHCQHE